jgi:hypothetical protein
MTSLWHRVMSPALAGPLRITVHGDSDPPRTMAWALRNDRLVIALAAVLTAVIWYAVEPIVVTHDTFAYLDAAKFIAGVEGGSFSYFRPPLLPLLLAVTGVPGRQTYFWFILTQLALGIASIMLMHDCLRSISKSLGLIGSAVFIATFIGFVYSKSIMTEEIYLFGWCLCINGGLAYLRTGAQLRLAQTIIALLILTLTRAQGAYVIAAVVPILAFARPRHVPAIAVGLIAYLLIIFGYGKLHASMARAMDDRGRPIQVSKLGISDSTGKMLFMVAYYDVYHLWGATAVAPENGPATQRMFKELNAYYSVPGRLEAMNDEKLFRRFSGKPDDLLKAMQREPDTQYWFSIWPALDERLGAAESDALLLRVTLEAILAHPFSIMSTYGRNFFVAFFVADSSYVWTHPTFGPEWTGPYLAKEEQASGDSSVPTALARVLDLLFPALRFLVVVGAIIVAPFAWRSRWRMSFVFCVTLVVYNQAAVALAATPESRYTFYIVPPLLAAVTMGLQAYGEPRASKRNEFVAQEREGRPVTAEHVARP